MLKQNNRCSFTVFLLFGGICLKRSEPATPQVHYCIYPFQLEDSIRKEAALLVRLPSKTLPKSPLQPESQHPFSLVKLRHVDRTHSEAKPEAQPESADPPASSSASRQSAIHFMSRVLRRLREVDEHVSEVITICLSTVFNSISALFKPLCRSVSWSPPKNAPEWMLIIRHALIIHLGLCNV